MDKMTSSVKREVRNVSQCRQKRTDPYSTRSEYLVKFGLLVFEIRSRTDRYAIFLSHAGGGIAK